MAVAGVNYKALNAWQKSEREKNARHYAKKGIDPTLFDDDDGFDALSDNWLGGPPKADGAQCRGIRGLPTRETAALQAMVDAHGIQAVLKTLHEIASATADTGDLCENFDDLTVNSDAWRKLAQLLDGVVMRPEVSIR